ncbi:MAG: peroxide stress protein YaaA [Filifactoraceae bacterium]
MKILLSPSKTMNLKDIDGVVPSTPYFFDMTKDLVARVKVLTEEELCSAMQLSGTLGKEVYDAYQEFSYENKGYPALTSFTGLVYKRIGVEDFTREDFDFAQKHFRILSALYGVLLPFDGVQKYRLEMKTDWTVGGTKLYNYWQDRLYNKIFEEGETVVCLASNEYAKQLQPYIKEEDSFIMCSFLSGKSGRYQNKPTDAKIARGKMARYIIKNKIDNVEDLKIFDVDGYVFSRELSDKKNYVFIKK